MLSCSSLELRSDMNPQTSANRPICLFLSVIIFAVAPAIVSARFGQGRVLAISPHFEKTAGQEEVIIRAIEHVRKQTTAATANRESR